jgi:hypothetical protein
MRLFFSVLHDAERRVRHRSNFRTSSAIAKDLRSMDG